MNNYPLLQKIGSILTAAADKIAALAQKVEALPGKVPEILALLFYAAAHLGMALVHEPWFDEAEAWQIARCVSLRTLFLETTHYEGHPPLWHLILMPFAKAGAPYELSLTLVSLLFMGAAVFLILWYAPFPRLVRLLLPFTYFFFYQYGVISRVYCVMTLAFVLLAIVYQRRNERPGRYVAVLILLCTTMAYGLVIAGGLAIVWLWEIWNEGAWKQSGQDGGPSGRRPIREIVRGYITDRRIWWLAVLLSAALLVMWMIMPREDTYATAPAAPGMIKNAFGVRLLYTLFVMPVDTVLTDIYSDFIILSRAFLPISALVSGTVVGLLLWSLFLYYGRKRGTALLLVLPYSLFAAFSAAVYVSLHHIGIGLLYFCFWCWVTISVSGKCAEQTGEEGACSEKSAVERRKTVSGGGMPMTAAHVARCTAILLGTLAMTVSLFWTGAACVLDICKNYAPGRKDAAFIREHHLDRYRMMSGWTVEYDAEGNVWKTDINECDQAVNLAPYFEHNLFFNFNDGQDDHNYITHIRLSEEETLSRYESWRQGGLPQVLWMSPDLFAVYGEAVRWQDYVLVYQEDSWRVWKAGASYFDSDIHVRRELLEETGCVPFEKGGGK